MTAPIVTYAASHAVTGTARHAARSRRVTVVVEVGAQRGSAPVQRRDGETQAEYAKRLTAVGRTLAAQANPYMVTAGASRR